MIYAEKRRKAENPRKSPKKTTREMEEKPKIRVRLENGLREKEKKSRKSV